MPKDIVNGKNLDKNKKKQICFNYKLDWENALVNSIGKAPFTGPNKTLVNTL